MWKPKRTEFIDKKSRPNHDCEWAALTIYKSVCACMSPYGHEYSQSPKIRNHTNNSILQHNHTKCCVLKSQRSHFYQSHANSVLKSKSNESKAFSGCLLLPVWYVHTIHHSLCNPMSNTAHSFMLETMFSLYLLLFLFWFDSLEPNSKCKCNKIYSILNCNYTNLSISIERKEMNSM